MGISLGKLVVLKLDGDLERQGFRGSLEVGSEGERPVLEVAAALPSDPELLTRLNQWQQAYRSLGMGSRIMPQEIIYGGSVNRLDNCRRSAYQLRDRFNFWLESPQFRPVDRRLREVLTLDEPIRILIRTQDRDLWRLPWHFWDFVDHYFRAEVALASSNLEQIQAARIAGSDGRVRILAILGNRVGISVEEDRALLEQLPDAEVTFLVEPSRRQITQQLWDQHWDILFFAGHSQTEGKQGRIDLNAEEKLTLEELKYGLRWAIANGLQLAIFNSCDGLGLAQELEQLRLPQMIIMREPVPDRVAQEFLKHFLMAFVQGESLYLAERQARERLQGLESEYPCASWLPIICQTSTTPPLTWHQLAGTGKTMEVTPLP
ncbi:MAG: CHAT domain-containing protein, partial [Kovacikia sp.]